MNRPSALTCLASVAVVCGLAFAQPTGAQDDTQALRQELAELKSQVEELQATRLQVDQLVQYVQAQAAAGKVLTSVLAESEEKGFTYGINPESRVVLLKGLNALASTLQTTLTSGSRAEPTPRGGMTQQPDR